MASGEDARYFDRELSWLAFNERVLQEAADPSVPLGERLGFLAIFSSNLDEFFRVRVASLRSLLRLKKKKVRKLEIDPAALLADIHLAVTEQQERFGRIFRMEVLPALAEHGIRLLTESDLSPDRLARVTEWFDEHVRDRIEPVMLTGREEPPFLENGAIYLVVELWPREGRGFGAVAPEYALVRVPSPPLPRFTSLDSEDGGHDVLFLDDVIRANLPRLFPERHTGSAWAIKLSRDAELYLEDEFEGDIVESIRKSLRKRETGLPCRFLYDMQTPAQLASVLGDLFHLEPEDLVPGGRYHNLNDLRSFPGCRDASLTYPSLDPLPHPDLEAVPSLIDAIADRDRLLHFPYQRFDYVIRLLDEAAADPTVEEIWITLYRVASDSAIAEALIRAALAGKRVTAFVELKARFDEEANLNWSERMEEAGVRTFYSLPGLKVHAKLALIVRRDQPAIGYFGTGNFNERTSRIYTDLALLTADPRLTSEMRQVFAFITGEVEEPEFEHLLVAPFTLRKRLYRLIAAEADASREGGTGRIELKMNSLQDHAIIDRLYRAARAGVDIELVVRGICCLVPGEPGLSETVRARSIVDRFLEHARIFIFENGGDRLCYLASADWMTRNLSRRVEVAFPIYDDTIRARIEELLDLQQRDNVKARIIDADQDNEYAPRDGEPELRAQIETYRFFEAQLAPARAAGVTGSTADGAAP